LNDFEKIREVASALGLVFTRGAVSLLNSTLVLGTFIIPRTFLRYRFNLVRFDGIEKIVFFAICHTKLTIREVELLEVV